MNKTIDPKARLIDIARDMFARRGFEGASVREITSKAKANLGAITYHFGSKEALYHAVIASCAEPLAERVAAAAAAPGTPLDRIETIVRTFIGFVAERAEFPRLMLRELSSGRPLAPPAQRAMQKNFGAIIEAVKAGQADGSIRPADPVLLVLSVMAQPFHFAIAGRFVLTAAGVDLNDPSTRARIVDHVVLTIRRAIAA